MAQKEFREFKRIYLENFRKCFTSLKSLKERKSFKKYVYTIWNLTSNQKDELWRLIVMKGE